MKLEELKDAACNEAGGWNLPIDAFRQDLFYKAGQVTCLRRIPDEYQWQLNHQTALPLRQMNIVKANQNPFAKESLVPLRP